MSAEPSGEVLTEEVFDWSLRRLSHDPGPEPHFQPVSRRMYEGMQQMYETDPEFRKEFDFLSGIMESRRKVWKSRREEYEKWLAENPRPEGKKDKRRAP